MRERNVRDFIIVVVVNLDAVTRSQTRVDDGQFPFPVRGNEDRVFLGSVAHGLQRFARPGIAAFQQQFAPRHELHAVRAVERFPRRFGGQPVVRVVARRGTHVILDRPGTFVALIVIIVEIRVHFRKTQAEFMLRRSQFGRDQTDIARRLRRDAEHRSFRRDGIIASRCDDRPVAHIVGQLYVERFGKARRTAVFVLCGGNLDTVDELALLHIRRNYDLLRRVGVRRRLIDGAFVKIVEMKQRIVGIVVRRETRSAVMPVPALDRAHGIGIIEVLFQSVVCGDLHVVFIHLILHDFVPILIQRGTGGKSERRQKQQQ